MDEISYQNNISKSFLLYLQKNSALIESTFNTVFSVRGEKLMIDENTVGKDDFRNYINKISNLEKEKGLLDDNDYLIALKLAGNGLIRDISRDILDKVFIKVNGKTVFPKSVNQKKYIKALKKNDLIFCLGPAGTGKTFLAIAMGLELLLNKTVDRIVLTRPVVEAGENLGFLPGDIQQKVNPYFRPLYDSLYYLIGMDKTSEFIERGIIELAPLAYMRGRTINNAFIILDEGQNTLNSQMKMFLTRIGQNSKVIITADESQIDLPEPKKSGIFTAVRILDRIKGIKVLKLTKQDVVRHSLVKQIIAAYERLNINHSRKKD